MSGVISISAFMVYSIPCETHATLAGPLPAVPARAVWLSLHAFMLLIVLAFARARAQVAVAPSVISEPDAKP